MCTYPKNHFSIWMSSKLLCQTSTKSHKAPILNSWGLLRAEFSSGSQILTVENSTMGCRALHRQIHGPPVLRGMACKVHVWLKQGCQRRQLQERGTIKSREKDCCIWKKETNNNSVGKRYIWQFKTSVLYLVLSLIIINY